MSSTPVPSPLEALFSLVDRSAVASLATLDEGSPAVSLAPYVSERDPLRLYVLLSELSPHTAQLRADPRCAVLIHDPPVADDPRSNHAITRLSFRATAEFLTRPEAEARGVIGRYRARFAIADTLLGLSDFHFVALTPVEGSGRFVQGFGRAYALRAGRLEHLTGR